MKIFEAASKGAKFVLGNKKMVFIIYLINLFFGMIVVYPVYKYISSFTSNSISADAILERFNYTFLVEMFIKCSKYVGNFSASVLIAGVFYVIVSIFIAGGILKILKSDNKFDSFSFFGGCGEFFLRFFRLFIYSLIFILLYFVFFIILSEIFVPSSKTVIFIFGLFFIAGFCFIDMIFDYAKIETVFSENRKMHLSLFNSIVFTFKNFFKVILLYSFIFLAGILLFLIYILILNISSETTVPGILLMVIIQQIYIFSKFLIQTLFYSAQFYYFTGNITTLPEKIPDNTTEDEISQEEFIT